MKRLPIACTLSPEALERRRNDLHGLVSRVVERHVSDDRLTVRFDGSDDVLPDLSQYIRSERECCRFLRFRLTAEEDAGPIWLEISGPPGTGAFVESLLPGKV